jgi:hypothetical protein
MFFDWFPFKKEATDSVITSDTFLKKEGFLSNMLRLGRMQKPKG